MSRLNQTWRDVDGERVEGTWRPVFIHKFGCYFLIDLCIYADALIDCEGLTTLAEFEEKVACGFVATEIKDGGEASSHGLAGWTFARPEPWISAEKLIGEVRDEIERLNNRPISSDRCLDALQVFLEKQTEANRDLLREAYAAVPQHERTYLLRDMDRRDRPLRDLITGPDQNAEHYAEALQYFAAQDRARTTRERPEPDEAGTSVVIPDAHYANETPDDPRLLMLSNQHRAEISIEGVTYPSAEHAYWALAVVDEDVRARVIAEESRRLIEHLVRGAQLREHWDQIRLSVMTDVLRAKFAQHPDAAATLIGTGSARLIHHGPEHSFWTEDDGQGRNWIGRILELLRSDLIRAQLDA
ncbi:NADAR family protein [Kineosporia babensis]|uniref:NADAR family protein n=1 Tax=Kineosporia babensis TaxID=499548 RepID=A0A9X1SXD7_9ACTN|nr:NADAR family protein [Kineosporia babensis]MCD5315761.1 NADAR family protein [Kineosporia babensis]